MGKTDGDYYTLDDMFVSKAAEKERFGEREESQRRKAIAEHQSLTAQMARCLYCFDSSQFPKHLIVAIGVKVRNKTQTRYRSVYANLFTLQIFRKFFKVFIYLDFSYVLFSKLP